MTTATLPQPRTGGLGGVLRAENRKFLSTRLWWIMALGMVAYMAFLAAMMAFSFNFDTDLAAADPAAGMPTPREAATSIYTLAPTLGYVFPLIVGAISVTSEFRHQTITPTLLAEPSRGRLVGAKLLAAIPVGLVIGVLGALTCWLVGGGVIALMGGESYLLTSETLQIIPRSAVALAIWAMVGVGFGTVVPNQVGSIIIVLAFTQFVEPVARMAISSVDSIAGLAKFLPGAAGEALAGGSIYDSFAPGSNLNTWQGGLVLIAYAVIFSAIGRLTTLRRDID